MTFEFLKTLGFKSSNDRPIITIMKGIGFLDSNGKPTEQYKSYRSYEGAQVLGQALRSAYSDIFLANTKAQTLSLDKLKGIIASKTTKGDAIVERIARTFQALAKVGDFSEVADSQAAGQTEKLQPEPEAHEELSAITPSLRGRTPAFHYNIEIHLPTTTDITVYNAIFKSLKENLL